MLHDPAHEDHTLTTHTLTAASDRTERPTISSSRFGSTLPIWMRHNLSHPWKLLRLPIRLPHQRSPLSQVYTSKARLPLMLTARSTNWSDQPMNSALTLDQLSRSKDWKNPLHWGTSKQSFTSRTLKVISSAFPLRFSLPPTWLPKEVIIGTDFLDHHGAVVNLEDDSLSWKGQSGKMSLRITTPPSVCCSHEQGSLSPPTRTPANSPVGARQPCSDCFRRLLP